MYLEWRVVQYGAAVHLRRLQPVVGHQVRSQRQHLRHLLRHVPPQGGVAALAAGEHDGVIFRLFVGARGDALRPVRPLADAPSSLFDGCFISTQVRRPQPLPGGISSGVIVSSGFQVLHSAELQAVQAVVESDRGTRGELDGRLRAAAAVWGRLGCRRVRGLRRLSSEGMELRRNLRSEPECSAGEGSNGVCIGSTAALTELEIRKPQKSRCLTLTTLFQQHRLIVLPSCHLTTSDVCLGCFQSLHLPSRRFLNAPVETLANKTAPPTKSMKLFANGQDGSVISPGSKMPKCPKCNKEVYFAEKVTSLGKDWHRPCLRCEKCNKTLSAGSHSEHDGKPYCNRPCYAALFGPGGELFSQRGVVLGTREQLHVYA
uniref:LIM zinc-binding domain-containing protein n=1 Tax=Macrostomum lignano TaxID=282301 RepID=A0A1I8IRK8_9PLAT